jgi:signal transduction histidine kinase
MKLEERRPAVYTATLSAHELSALLAGARMSLKLMETDQTGSTERSREVLRSVLASFDHELERLQRRPE